MTIPAGPVNCESAEGTFGATTAYHLFARLSKCTYLPLRDIGELQELLLPLGYRDPASQSKRRMAEWLNLRRSAQDHGTFLDCTSRRDPHKCLSSTTRQNDDTGPGSTITKHLGERCLLIRSDNSHWLELDIEIGIGGIVSEIVLLQSGKIDILALTPDDLHLVGCNLERVDRFIFV
jgi:hypothetical protein